MVHLGSILFDELSYPADHRRRDRVAPKPGFFVQIHEPMSKRVELSPEGKAKQGALTAAIEQRMKAAAAEQVGLLQELSDAGVKVELVNYLPNWPNEAYKHALPVLAKHIVMPYSQGTLESLARSMAMREGAPYWDLLVDLYKKQPSSKSPEPGDFGMGLAAAISASLPKGRLDELMELIKNPSLRSRVLLLRPLQRRRNRDHRIAIFLEELRHDPEFSVEINSWKGMRRKPG